MHITESQLKRMIRQVILESMDHRGHLNSYMSRVLNNLIDDLKVESDYRKHVRIINMAIARMSDEWNRAGGVHVGNFVDECQVGIVMNEIQLMVYRDSSLTLDDIISKLKSVFNVIANCNFPELVN